MAVLYIDFRRLFDQPSALADALAKTRGALMLGLSSTGQCIAASTTLQQLTGRSADALQGLGWLEAVRPEERGPVGWIIRSAGRDGAAVSLHLRTAAGREVGATGWALPIRRGHRPGLAGYLLTLAAESHRLSGCRLEHLAHAALTGAHRPPSDRAG